MSKTQEKLAAILATNITMQAERVQRQEEEEKGWTLENPYAEEYKRIAENTSLKYIDYSKEGQRSSVLSKKQKKARAAAKRAKKARRINWK